MLVAATRGARLTTELYALTVVSVFTGVLWMPYILNRIWVGPGLLHEVGYPAEQTKLSPWAARLKKAHANAVENLVVFAALVLAAHVSGIQSDLTAYGTVGYVLFRAVHPVAYTFAIPWLRTLAFTGGWACQMAVAFAILAA